MSATVAPIEEFDVEYSEPCGDCARAGQAGVKVGFSFQAGGIICALGLHRQQEANESKAAAPKTAAAGKKLSTSGPFKSGGDKPEPERGKVITPVGEPQPKTPVRVHSAEDAAGGNLDLKLTIPERLASAVKAEAEIQHQSVEEYMQAWLEFALENQWGR